MTPKQRRFCDEYLTDCNATQAAIRAGYSPRTAYSIGEENLKKPELRRYLDSKLSDLSAARVADAEEILTYLTAVMRGETTAAELVTELTGNGVSKARLMATKPTERERLKAAELLGKRFGLFTDRLNVEGALPVVIQNDLAPD